MQGLFLGAGASYELGMPLVWELTKILKRDHAPETLRKMQSFQPVDSASHWSKESVELLISLLSDDDLHYEALIGAIEVETQRRYGPQDSYERIRLHLVDMVSRFLIGQHCHERKFTISGMKYAAGISKLIEANRPLNIFSLNHDVMVEEICAYLDEPIKAGFYKDHEYWSSAFSGAPFGFPFEVLTRSNMEAGAFDFFKPGEKGVNIYKLHGALDTFLFNSCQDFIRFYPKKIKSGGYIDLLVELNNENHRIEIEDGIRSIEMMTLKDSSGIEQFFDRSLITGAFKFQGNSNSKRALRVFFEKFKTDIVQIKELICIGYSFGDLHINSIISDWLRSSVDRRLVIVDPFCNAIPSFLLHLKKQVSIDRKTFLDYLMPSPATDQEKLERYIFKQVREFRRLQTFESI